MSSALAMQEMDVDTHEGSTVMLQCRFPTPTVTTTCFWLTHTNNAHDNAAIGSTALAPYYKVHANIGKGIYDLEIRNVSYDRDNGKYECRVKDSSTGSNWFHKNVTLTVLRTPGQPTISPTYAVAKEGEELKLNCNTYGGSPEPEVQWFRGDDKHVIHNGRELIMMPTKEDDHALFR